MIRIKKFLNLIILMIGVLGVVLLPTHFSVAKNYDNLTGTDLIDRILEFMMPNKDVWLYAVFEPNPYTINFDGNGSTEGSMSSTGVVYDQEIELPANKFKRDGYTFKGWSATGVIYPDKAKVKNLATTGSITLYAQRIEGTGSIEVSYTANFYQENADDTGYTLAYTEVLTGIVGDQTNIDIKEYSGFILSGNATDYQQELGWGGADIDIYYNRDVYTAYLKLPSGETISIFTRKYGSKIVMPDILQPYDEIVGWNPSIPDTMPIGGFTSVAQLNKSTPSYAGGGGRKSDGTSRDDSQGNYGPDNQGHYSSDDSTTRNSPLDHPPETELEEAYDFAYRYGITTQPTMESANLNGPLTRIEMAKMLSYYAINVLGMKPDVTRYNVFADVSKGLDAAYDSGVTLAYQLGIMGINMPNNRFRPFDIVPRAEFVTALSRLLYNTEDGEYVQTSRYYVKHFEKLKEKNIVTLLVPNMQEIRGYVMIMLMRSMKVKENDKDDLIKQYLYNIVYGKKTGLGISLR